MSDALNALWVAFTEFVPRLLGAALVLVVALLAARILQNLGARLLRQIRLDDTVERAAALSSLQRAGFGSPASTTVGYVIFWGILLAGIAASLSVLGLSSLQENMDLIAVLLGRALVAVLILAGGLAAAGWLSNRAAREAERAGLRGIEVFRQTIFVMVLAIAALLAAAQVGIEVSLLVVLAVLFLGTAGLIAAIALGAGLVPLSGNIAAGRYVRGNGIGHGDDISVDGVEGTVEELGLASVTLRSEDGRIHHVPNRILLEGVVSKRAPQDQTQEPPG